MQWKTAFFPPQLGLGSKELKKKSVKYVDLVQSEFNPFPDDKILDWSKLKQIADDIIKCI